MCRSTGPFEVTGALFVAGAGGGSFIFGSVICGAMASGTGTGTPKFGRATSLGGGGVMGCASCGCSCVEGGGANSAIEWMRICGTRDSSFVNHVQPTYIRIT